jgi:hypothetical protein
MEPAIEKKLFEDAGVTSVSDLEGFPFSSHADFVSAIENGTAELGVATDVAIEVVEITKSPGASIAIQMLALTPFVIAAASIPVAFLSRNWLTLFGIVTAVVGTFVAHPYIPFRGLCTVAAIPAVAYVIATGNITTVWGWTGLSFFLSFLAVSVVNGLSWRWAYFGTLQSEALTVFLWNRRGLNISKHN